MEGKESPLATVEATSDMRGWATVYLGLGANEGVPLEQLRSAVSRLEEVARVILVSSVYRSSPVGFADQPDFLNLVCIAETVETPQALLRWIHGAEESMGRRRTFPNAPRPLDIDILAYDDLVMDEGDLVIPHPRMHERGFVLVPLAEIAPDWCHPVLHRTATQLADARGWEERVEWLGPL